ncbi:hypothetical protein ACIPCF_07880 [Paracoccus marcusii]|uniref:hypothetical protein n=1 Tax=Paracoccus marcusii TaxID=59779 RepID=UPI0024904D8E|nr:hypothetical protein [Paracoccus marcusii]|tara:strand:+ start:950 stop:1177 length:228 start_codon:yes stop_codon:yes gene_type:complete
MIPIQWARRHSGTQGQARVAQIERDLCARSKAGTEATIAELRAKRAQVVLNTILDDVITASLGAVKAGGRDNGDE